MHQGQMSPCPNRLHFFTSRDPFYKVNLNLGGHQTSGFSKAIKQFNKQLVLIPFYCYSAFDQAENRLEGGARKDL